MTHKPNWLLDEIASAGRENLDAVHVSRYDKKEDAHSGEELILLERYGLNSSSEAIDIGAGTGQFAIAAAVACARVVAVDVSPVMIERLRMKVGEANLSNIELVQAGFLTYEHRGRPADFVYSRLAMHHLPDFWKAMALKRIRGMMRVGGIFRLWDVVYDFSPDEAESRLDAWCNTFGSDVEREWIRDELEEHIREEHSTFRWLLEPMLERAGFDIEEVGYSPDGFFGRYVLRAK